MSAKWFDHLPQPVSQPAHMSIHELHERMTSKVAGKEFIVVDVRRTDIAEPDDHIIKQAINLPAQTFYQTLPGIFSVLSDVPEVIFHCSSSNGRGPRCAAWYQDELDDKGIVTSQAFVLTGGINAWVARYPNGVVRA
ncbi:hypothetical protein NliqN6_5944 [Naganishia liquefaciens]|uniref:Rhodanese domain-containing protein n=1 Tax=Naganishia liquefaciens TaxID=104408 RepID=A0A8H3TYN7_9TREE|nr:hypothetical protein NCC49_006061 [Naganishia albida]GHJ89542.1 hypothetical protein NliqN6_5944 [Naganishia liquefaciens]